MQTIDGETIDVVAAFSHDGYWSQFNRERGYHGWSGRLDTMAALGDSLMVKLGCVCVLCGRAANGYMDSVEITDDCENTVLVREWFCGLSDCSDHAASQQQPLPIEHGPLWEPDKYIEDAKKKKGLQ